MVQLTGPHAHRQCALIARDRHCRADGKVSSRCCGAAGSLLQVNLLTMPFNRDVKLNVGRVQAMAAQLQSAAQTRAFLCVSRESLLSRMLKPQVPFVADPMHSGLCVESGW